MRRVAGRLGAGLLAAVVLLLGGLGAYGYGKDYALHRGFTTPVQLPRAGTGRLLDVHFHSEALGRNADYMVYLPPGYTPSRHYPVYYLLHGMPGQPHVFVTIANLDVRLDDLLSLGQVKPMILVFPDGRIDGSVMSDSEWANTPSGQFESYVLDVMHDVDARFSTLPFRQDRVIGGFSAGAYGAINIALHHLSDFGSVQVWSGYFTETRSGVFAHASQATLAYNSPIDYIRVVADQIRREGLNAYLFVGRDDESAVQLPPMVQALRAAGARVGWAVYPGGHDWSVWYPQLNPMLILASHDMGAPPAAPILAARSQLAVPSRHRGRRGGHGSGGSHRRLPTGDRHGSRRVHSRPRVRRVASVTSSATPGAGGPALTASLIPMAVPAAGRDSRRAASGLALLAALALALVSGALVNLGFVLQHRGLRDRRRTGSGLADALRSRCWLSGQLVGWIGFGGQIVAVALAPLTLVQAFAAGSLALSIPLVARIFGTPVKRAQLIAIAIVAISLLTLPVGAPAHHGALREGVLIGACLAGAALVAISARFDRPGARAATAGLCYGLADAAIKADAIGVRAHGPAALLSGFTVVAALATLGGFAAFQSALRRTDAVSAVSLMNALTAVTALALGMLAFGESLGATPAVAAMHAIAIAAVLACVRPLARGQQELAGETKPTSGGSAHGTGIGIGARHPVAGRATGRLAPLRSLAAGTLAAVVVVGGSVTAIGLLYALRTLGWLAVGPRVGDSLPLLQLAGFAGQPLLRVAFACLLTGVAMGVALRRLAPPTRIVLIALLAAGTLLLASDASFALAHNLRFAGVLRDRAPGFGPWLQALLLAGGAVLPAALTRIRIVDNSAATGALRAGAGRLLRASGGLGGPRPVGH